MRLRLLTIFMICASPAFAGETAPAERLSGYEWARDNGVENEQSCETESTDFNAGCLSFIAESRSESQDPADAEPSSGAGTLPTGFDFPDDEFTVLE